MPEDFRFIEDEQGRVVLIRGEERIVLGPVLDVGDEMCRFLAGIDFPDFERA
jgi:hypothetical protein